MDTNKNSSQVTPIPLYNSEQVYAMEQAWFAQGFDSFALMQQAAWQMTQRIKQLVAIKSQSSTVYDKKQPQASIWVGSGNNGGDGWLIGHYLQQAGWKIEIITVGNDKTSYSDNDGAISDAIKAENIALAANCPVQCYKDSDYCQSPQLTSAIDVYIDALFGIGLDRAPEGIYKQAILSFNQAARAASAMVIAVDIPSGLVASTGQVYDHIAIQADITLCLIARKFGLHTKDGMDYAGHIIDMPLIPYNDVIPTAILLSRAYRLPARRQNSHKGSYGQVLVIGGNQINGSRGMGGAAILAASSAMTTGAGKITVACHKNFHTALLTSLADAMTIDLHDKDGVKDLIKDADVIAIGMGLGRDDEAKQLFISYLQASIEGDKTLVIDADGLYHLATLRREEHKLIRLLKAHSKKRPVYLTPHSGEAAKLLNQKVAAVEADRLAAIKQCADDYGGSWVLKGAGSLVLEQGSKHSVIYVCSVGNAGMATAGMGDILSGLTAGLLTQQDLNDQQRSLRQAVLIHGLAADTLVNPQNSITGDSMNLLIGQRGLQAQDMPAAIRHVIQLLTT